ncbi:DUF4221 family protein [Cyclobacterium amurskyense]|uniref:DUF4221 family protein n=1 Tax=Cyclobacterium amurskyense TaxID=320787 RepID=UPI0030DB0B6A
MIDAKILYRYFILLFLYSCNQKIDEDKAYQLTFAIDTVMVDSGKEILDLQTVDFALSPDKKYYYNFNSYNHSLEKIDLEELKLNEMLPFDKEGPNGTVDRIFYLKMIDENIVQLANDNISGQFHLDGTRTGNHNLYSTDLKGDELNDFEYIKKGVISLEQPGIIYALVNNWKDKTFNLRKMDFRKMEIKKYDIDAKGKIPKYTFKVPTLSKDPITSPALYLSSARGKLIVSTDISNEISLFDPDTDSIFTIKNEHKLTANEKLGDFPGEYNSIEELMVDYRKMYEEISFSPPVWDNNNERYYRLSYQVTYGKKTAPESYIFDIAQREMFFSIYDKNFELIGEAILPYSLKTLSKPFIREGMLWLKVNIADELGFLRIKPNLKDER